MREGEGFIQRSDLFCEDFGAAKAAGGRVMSIIKINGLEVLFGDHNNGDRRGRYATLECGRLFGRPDSHSETVHAVSEILSRMSNENLSAPPKRILVAGLGNEDVTADSLGSKAAARVSIIGCGKHSRDNGLPETYVIKPGTSAACGIDSAKLVKSIAELVEADLVICIDALAARSVERLGSVIQISDAGISPGSGVSRHTSTISHEALGIPTLAIGIPTVISGGAVYSLSAVDETEETLFTVAAVDSLVKLGGAVIAGAINLFFTTHCKRI